MICAIVNMGKESVKVKILFINLPYHGHVIPTIGLVQELIKAGHRVTYLMPYDWEERIADSGAEFLDYVSSAPAEPSWRRRSSLLWWRRSARSTV